MTQDQLVLLLLKIGLVAAILSLAVWITVYSRLQPWWHDSIGITLVTKSALVIGQLVFLSLALFFHLSRLDNRVIAWAYTAFTLAIAPVMIWRTIVWIQASRSQETTITEDDHDDTHVQSA